jgi:hypothetical protein
MVAEFATVHNYQEQRVFEVVTARAAGYPAFAAKPDLLEDVACVALNRLPPRYIRNSIDMSFFMSSQDRAKSEAAIEAAVAFAFDFVQRRQYGSREGAAG